MRGIAEDAVDEPGGSVTVQVRMSRSMYEDIAGLSVEMDLMPGGVVMVALRLLCWLCLEHRWGSRLLIARGGLVTEWAVSELEAATTGRRPAPRGGWRWLRGLAVMARGESESS